MPKRKKRKKRNEITEITFMSSATGRVVKGRVIQTVIKSPNRGYVVVEYKTSAPFASQQTTLRECIIVTNGYYRDVITWQQLEVIE